MTIISSMTGSSSLVINNEFMNLTIDITSVNNRLLDVYLKLPDQLRHLESKLRGICQNKLTRGKIDCYLNYELSHSDSLTVNTEALKAVAQAVAVIRKEIQDITVNALEILEYPGIVSQEKNLQNKIDSAVLSGFTAAIDNLIESRSKEGEKLKEKVTDRLDLLQNKIIPIGSMLDTLVEQERKRLLKKLEGYNLEIDSGRLEQEIVLAAQRADVREEYDRIQTHIKEVRSILKTGGICGKRLDFIMQEFNRETNTLTSKAMDLELNKIGVELKVIIEQMREQVQNIE